MKRKGAEETGEQRNLKKTSLTIFTVLDMLLGCSNHNENEMGGIYSTQWRLETR